MSFFKFIMSATLFIFLVSCNNQPESKIPNEVPREVQKKVTHAVQNELHNEFCSNIDLMANAMMGARQAGVPMAKMIKFTDETNDPELKKIYYAMVKAAFETPRFEVEENRKKAALDFRNSMYQSCLK